MGDGVDDHHHAIGDEKRGQYIGQGHQALQRIPQQHAAGKDGNERRQQRPAEARRLARPHGEENSGEAGNHQHPPKEDRGGKPGERRHNDRRESEKDQKDSLGQESLPMIVDRLRDHGRELRGVRRIGLRHDRSPSCGWVAQWQSNIASR
jgi:hypothetical protein